MAERRTIGDRHIPLRDGYPRGYPRDGHPRGARPPDPVADVLAAAVGAGLGSAFAAAAVARSAGKGALQPLNATSHWLHGPEAGRVRGVDATHSGVGIATHALSALFWAVPYALWLGRKPVRSDAGIVGGAAVTTLVAAAVDYLVMPRRLTPGWELAIGRTGTALTFAGLGLGLAAGALAVCARR